MAQLEAAITTANSAATSTAASLTSSKAEVATLAAALAAAKAEATTLKAALEASKAETAAARTEAGSVAGLFVHSGVWVSECLRIECFFCVSATGV